MNTLLTIAMITREALMVLENSLTFTKRVRRDFDDKFGVEGAKIGTTLNVRKPPRYVGRVGQALQLEAAEETQVQVRLDTQMGVDLSFSAQDLKLSIDDFSDRFLKPAIATVANRIDNDGLALYKKIYQSVGSPTVVPNAILTYLQAGVKLDESAAPRDGQRAVVISPMMQATIVDALKTLFQQATAIASQYEQGIMGKAIGVDWYMDQNVNAHVVGTFTASGLVNGANQDNTASLITDGWTSGGTSLKEGDVFTIANVYSVNPQSRQSTGSLQQFRVTQDISDTTGAITLNIEPSIVSSGRNQTVNSIPADNAQLTVVGTSGQISPQGLMFHKDAFVLACADLPLPNGVDMAARMSDNQLGLSIRMVRDYDINNDQFPCRLDILYGWATLRPELATRIQS